MTLKGDVFIIPNNAASMRTTSDFFKENFEKKLKRIEEDFHLTLDYENCILVQVWVTNDQSENWSDHGIDLGNNVHISGFPGYIPLPFFEGKKEGNIITFKFREYDVGLKLNQTSYRYASFGKFEEVLEKVTLQARTAAAA